MNEQASIAPRNTQWHWPAFLVVSFWLIASALWRLTVAAHEYPMRRMQVLTMVLDALMIVGVLGAWRRVAVRDDDMVMGHIRDGLLFAAVLAGIALFAIRLTSNAAWWTGHFDLPPVSWTGSGWKIPV